MENICAGAVQRQGGGEGVFAEARRVWAGGGGTVMRGPFSPQNTSTGADFRPKMPGKAHRMAIYKSREMVSELPRVSQNCKS